MSLESYLENLRSKPEHVRRRTAFWYSFGFTAIIFAFWLASFGSIGINVKGSAASVASKAGTPVQSLTAAVGTFAGNIKDMIFTPKKIQYSQVEVSAGKR